MLPALIRKFHDAKASGATEVEIWGTGSPMREFLHVDDLADACLHLMRHYSDDSHINVGTGIDLSIRDLAEKVRDLVYPAAQLRFDTSKPDGTPRKVLDVTRLEATGWKPKIDLDTGLRETYQWFLDQQAAHADLRGMLLVSVAGTPKVFSTGSVRPAVLVESQQTVVFAGLSRPGAGNRKRRWGRNLNGHGKVLEGFATREEGKTGGREMWKNIEEKSYRGVRRTGAGGRRRGAVR